MVVASPTALAEQDDSRTWSHVRVATKYPNVTRKYFASRGVQAECIKLNGAMELAPGLGLCRRIVDLVETGSTLKANGLVEVEQIAEISSRFVVNRAAWKTRPDDIGTWVNKIRDAVDGA
jgi:ATP phosphoribosyltransferase